MRSEVEQAVQLLQSGGDGGIDRAVALLQNTVFSFSMRVCGHREDAEDTMQEVLTRAVRYLPGFTSAQALGVWLYTVAKNRCLMSRRRSKFVKQQLSLEELMPDAGELERLAELGSAESTPESNLLRKEHSEEIRAAVHKVPPPYRLILVLHDMEQLSTAEIARVTGLREGTVRVRLHRARLFVRRELARVQPGHTRRTRPSRRGHAPRPTDCKAMFAALSDYLDGLLDLPTCEHLQKHISDCKPCEKFLATLRSTVEKLQAIEGAKPDPATAKRLREELVSKLQEAIAIR